MPTTRAKRNADDRYYWLRHFIFFCRPTDSPAFIALEQYGEKLYDNFVKHDDYIINIQNFRYTDDKGVDRPLDSETIERLTKWRQFYTKMQQDWGLPTKHGSWDLTTVDGMVFEDYLNEEWDNQDAVRIDTAEARANGDERLRLERQYGSQNQGNATNNINSGSSNSGGNPKTAPEVTAFNKLKKGTSSEYPVLDKDHNYNGWRRKFQAHLRRDKCDKILDPNYNPPAGTPEAEVFDLVKIHTFPILQDNLTTMKGMELTREHADDGDSQEVMTKLDAHYTRSNVASLHAQKLLRAINKSEMPSVLRKSRESYLHDFRNLIKDYNEVAPQPMSTEDQLLHIKRFAGTSAEVKGAKASLTVADVAGFRIDPNEAMRALEHVVIEADDDDKRDIIEGRRSHGRNRLVQFHEQDEDVDNYYDHQADDDELDDATYADRHFQAYHAEKNRDMVAYRMDRSSRRRDRGRSNRIRVPNSIWKQLPQEDITLIGQLTDDTLLKLLTSGMTLDDAPRGRDEDKDGRATGNASRNQRSAHLTEIDDGGGDEKADEGTVADNGESTAGSTRRVATAIVNDNGESDSITNRRVRMATVGMNSFTNRYEPFGDQDSDDAEYDSRGFQVHVANTGVSDIGDLPPLNPYRFMNQGSSVSGAQVGQDPSTPVLDSKKAKRKRKNARRKERRKAAAAKAAEEAHQLWVQEEEARMRADGTWEDAMEETKEDVDDDNSAPPLIEHHPNYSSSDCESSRPPPLVHRDDSSRGSCDTSVDTSIEGGVRSARVIQRASPNSPRRVHIAARYAEEPSERRVSRHSRNNGHGRRKNGGHALLDWGANGGMRGSDMGLIAWSDPPRYVNVTGLKGHQVTNLRIGTFGGVISTNHGPAILICHEYADQRGGDTIHSPLQAEDNGVVVDSKPKRFGGSQTCVTSDGYVIPLSVRNGLSYMEIRPFTKEEYLKLPHITFTRDIEWDPSIYDNDMPNDPDWPGNNPPTPPLHPGFDHQRNPIRANVSERQPPVVSNLGPYTRSDVVRRQTPLLVNVNMTTNAHYREQRHQDIDFESMRRHLLGVPVEVVQRTFEATTQFYRNYGAAQNITDTRKSPYPANNVPRINEDFYTDTMVSDTRAWGGNEFAQIFAGRSSYFVYARGLVQESEFPEALMDFIRKYGAPDKLCSDEGRAEISKRVLDILRMYRIDDWQSEPHFQWQNFAERIIQEIKKYINWILNYSGAPAEAWYLALKYVVYIWNRTARKLLGWRTPHEAAFGNTPDLGPILHFEFWERVLIKNYQDAGFPSTSNEVVVHFVGFAENTGNIGAFLVWNANTKQLLVRSRVKRINSDLRRNRRVMDDASLVDTGANRGIANPLPIPAPVVEEMVIADDGAPDDAADEDPDAAGADREQEVPNRTNEAADPEMTQPPPEPPPRRRSTRLSRKETEKRNEMVRLMHEKNGERYKPPVTRPPESDLLGRTYLRPIEEDGTRQRAKILECVEEYKGQLEKEPERVKFRVKVGDTTFEEMVEYNDLCDFIEEQAELDNGTWRFREIIGHRIKGRQKQVLVVWESGERSWQPASFIWHGDKYVLAKYCKENGLLDSWSTSKMNLRKTARREKNLLRMCRQAKLHSYKNAVIYMYGVKVPRNHQQAMEYDEENGDTQWADSEKLEIRQIHEEYKSFRDLGHKSVAKPPPGYKKITLHMVYAVKHDGRRKSRLVAGGHLTDPPLESVYAGVVSLRGVRLVVFLAELNGLKVWQTDVGNAYLLAKTREKVYVVAGEEFESFGLTGHLLVIVTAVYGLASSGRRWHDRFADVLREMGFKSCPAEPDIWMRECDANGDPVTSDEGNEGTKDGHHYEYIAVYTDDLTIASKKPERIIGDLENTYKFKLKGTGELSFLLGCDYIRDEDGVLRQEPKKYIEKMVETYERLFGEKPRKATSPLVKGDHPELDTSELLDDDGMRIYQSMIGAAQWIIQLCRFDIAVHVMTLSSFRAQPRVGHLERMKRVYGYLFKMKGGAIRIRTEMPDVSDLQFEEHDWSQSPYAGTTEETPENLPRALGKPVLLVTYADANLCHDMLSGKAVTGILHFINKTPFDWFSKKQNTVETATYGAESVAGRTAIEQMRANKLTLQYLGVPIKDTPILVGDNKTVVDAATVPDSRLHKRHLMLSFHFLKAAIASKAYRYAWIDGKDNVSDILTKHWGYQQVWPVLRPVLFWEGRTMDILRTAKKALLSLGKRKGNIQRT